MVEEVTCYETEDGAVFEKQKEAEAHGAIRQFRKWYVHNNIVANNGHFIVDTDIVKWIFSSRVEVTKLLYKTLGVNIDD